MEDHKRMHAMYHVLGTIAIIGIVVTMGAIFFVVLTTALCTEGSYVCEEDAAIESS